MFRLFPRRLPKDVADELASLCHTDQIERLAAPKALHKDIGVDCGCDVPKPLTKYAIF